MKTLKQIDAAPPREYDIEIGEDGDFVFSEGNEAYGNILTDIVRTVQGEMQLDTEKGIPYGRTIWTSVKELQVWMIYVRRAVESYPFVMEIESFTADIVGGNNLRYTLIVSTDAGTVEVTG